MNQNQSLRPMWEEGMLGFRTKPGACPAPGPELAVLDWSELRNALAKPILLSAPVHLHLVRHGETETNARSIVTGAQDVPLTARGDEQARRIGQQLDSHFELAIHSTLTRSRRTLLLAIEAGHIKVDKIRSDPRLNERSLGVLEMRPMAPGG